MLVVPRRKISMCKGVFAHAIHLLFRNQLTEGKYIKEFEKNFAAYIGVKGAVSVSSGTAALSLILESLSLKEGDEVILPAYTFPSVPSCIKTLGLVPRFVDINPDSDSMDAEGLKDKINDSTRVIIATHLFGKPCDIQPILALVKSRGIFIIEDCAHAIGSEYNHRKLGSFGDAAFFSFSLTKPFNTFNGGMVTSNNSALLDSIRERVEGMPFMPKKALFKNICVCYLLYFLTKPSIFTFSLYPILVLLSLSRRDLINSYNRIFKKLIFYGTKKFRFSNLQALIGIKMLSSYDHEVARRAEKVNLFNHLCREAELPRLYSGASETKGKIFHYFYVIKHPKRDIIARDLLWGGIDTGKYIMRNCPPLFSEAATYKNTEDAYNHSLQLPIEHCDAKKMRIMIKVLKKHLSGT